MNDALAWRVRSTLDVDTLRAAFLALVARHPVLRATYASRGGEPVQVIHGPGADGLDVIDATAWSETKLCEAVEQEACRAFDLAREPAFRCRLFTRTEGQHVLLTVTHRIAVDARSAEILLTDLGRLYGAALRGGKAELPALPVSYADFVERQVRALAGPRGERLGRAWQRRLEGAPLVLELPGDRVRPDVRTWSGSRQAVQLDDELSGRLRALARSHDATLYMVLLAAFQALVCRMTGQQDLLVGTPAALRDEPDFTHVVGCFVNPLVMRARLEDDPTFKTFLAETRRRVTEAFEDQGYPFALLAERLLAERDPGRSPLFQVTFALETAPRPGEWSYPETLLGRGGARIDLGEWILESTGLAERHSWLDLTLTVVELADGGLAAGAQYSTDLFDPTTVRRLLAHFQVLLAAVAEAPEGRISHLPLLQRAACHQLLLEWSSSAVAPPPRELFVDQLFARQAARHPEAVAAVAGAQQMTYGELNRRANRLAHWLLSRGAAREARVAVLGHRGFGMLTVILGLAKAGAVYVPMEPVHPDPRLRMILEDCGARHLAVGAGLARRAAELVGGLPFHVEIFCWEERPPETELPHPATWSTLPADDPPSRIGPHDLANVFYTSGSTGRPKGAMVEHQGMRNHLDSKIELLGLGAQSVVAQNASHGFDISIWQFLGPLLVGGRVVIYDADTVADVSRFLPRVEEDGITVLETVPSLLELMLSDLAPTIALPALQFLMSTGEAISVALARRWQKRFPRIPLINAFGPTECSDDVTHQVFRSPLSAATPRIVVGRPIFGMQVYVLDRSFRPVPVGCSGQIMVSGVGVGRGYLGDGAKTAQAFVPDPFARRPGERLYLTGDLGRWTSAATLEFLGRIGHQVKVRGQRFELGEVEAVLIRHPAVRQAVATVRPGPTGQNRLLAYVVGDAEVDVGELGDLLRQHLPLYMVPESFTVLETLPLNPNGKVDRKALPEPRSEPGKKEYVAPGSELEERLAAVYQQVLEVERVGIHDNFFDLGGHSLKAVQATSRLQRALGLEVSVRQLFLFPTVAELAASLSGDGSEAAGDLPAVEYQGEQPSYELSIAQEAQWMFLQILPGDHGRKPPEILELRGEVERTALRTALGDLVARHEMLRTTFSEIAGKPRQTIHETLEILCPEDDLAALDRHEQQHRLQGILDEEARPFDLAEGPLLRSRLVRLEAARYLLLLNLPHIASDGWSEQLIFRQLAELYNDRRAGRESSLAPPALRYVDFAAWQREHLSFPAMIAQRDFWLEQLRGVPATPWLPSDRLEPGETPGAAAVAKLDRHLSARIEELAGSQGVTPFMVYTAAFKILLARWTGQTDLVVGSVVEGRSLPELEELVGVFIQAVALRTSLAGEMKATDLLEDVRKKTLAALANQDHPFHSWLESLRRERQDSTFMPYSVNVLPQKEPVLTPFDALEASFRFPFQIFDDEVAAIESLSELIGPGMELTLGISEAEEGVVLALVSPSGQLRRATLERLLGQLIRILEQVTHDPARRLDEISLLAGEAERRSLAELAHGGSGAAVEETLLRAVESWAEPGTTDAVAIVSGTGEVAVSDDPGLLDPYELTRYLLRHEATVLVAGPVLLEGFAAALGELVDPRTLPLRHVVSLGSAPRSGVSKLAGLVVFYPLAEATAAGLWAGPDEADEADGLLFAGRPAPAFPVHLLDAAQQPVPVGILGDLYLEAEAEGTGAPTPERFVAAGFRGRWRPDGTLEVVARTAPDSAPPTPEEPAAAAPVGPYRAPRTALERRLAVAWQKVLNRPQVGVEDDFFALGGSRRSAARATLLAGESDVLLLPGQIEQHRTIAVLAPLAERAMEMSSTPGDGAPPPAPLAPLQRELLEEALENPRGVVRSASLEVLERLDPASLRQALAALVERHDALRATFVRQGGLFLQALAESVEVPVEVPLEVIDLAGDDPEETEAAWRLAVDELRTRVDPISGPPLRALLGRRGPQTKLALAVSGLVADDASWPVMVADLAAAYRRAVEGTSPPGPGARSFHRWLTAAERLRAYREPRAGSDTDALPKLSQPWSRARFVTRRWTPEAPPSSLTGDPEELLCMALGRLLPGDVEVERDRRGGEAPLPELDTTVGQFGALWPAAVAPASGGARVRLRLLAVPAAGDDLCLALEDPPSPQPVFVSEGREPDVFVRVTATPQTWVVSVAVHPGASPGLTDTELAGDLVSELGKAVTTKPPGTAPEGEVQLTGVELDPADLDELFR